MFPPLSRLCLAAAASCVALSGLTLKGQETAAPPLTKAEREAAAAVRPPDLPSEPTGGESPSPTPPVAPPMPGEVVAPPTETPPASGDRIPDSWVQPPASPMVPRVQGHAPEVTRSTSTSGQFIVHGPELQIRSAVARRCEEVAEDLRLTLRDTQPWALPIVVHLRGPEESPDTGRPVSTQITEMDHGGFHLQVTVLARKDFRLRDLQDELIRVLLAERILRNQKAITSKRARLLPDWIFTGVTEAARYRNRNRPSALFAILFESGKIYSIEEIIEASPVEMDSLSRAIFDTSCCALVLALLDQSDGPERFLKFLGSLASDERSERELLDQWFPSFAASESSLNKWWALQLADLAQPTVAEPLGPTESYEAIKAALVLDYQAPLDEAPPSARPDLTTPAIPSPAPTPKPTPPPAPKAAEPAATVAEAAPTAGNDAPTAGNDAPGSDEMPGEEADTEDDDRNVFGKIFGFLKRGSGDGDESGSEAEMEAVEAIQEPEPVPAEEPAPEPKPAATEDPPATPTADTEATPSEDEKPTPRKKFSLRDLFRGKKSDTEEDTQESDGDAKEEEPADADESDANALRWLSPTSALIADLARTTWEQPASRQVFLKFLRKKKTGEGDEEEESDEDGTTETTDDDTKAVEEEAKPKPEKPKPESPPPPAPKPKPTPKPDLSKIVPLVNVSSPIEEYRWIMARKDRQLILNSVETKLTLLETRVGTLFRPVVIGYKMVIADLKEGKTKGVDDKLKSLSATLENVRSISNEIRTHVDWYQASHSAAYSGLFDEYLKLPETISNEVPKRSDPISNYLDALETEFAE